MRILLVADGASVHTDRWARALSERGHVIEVATLRDTPRGDALVRRLPTPLPGKAGYLLAIPALRRLIERMRPDVISAHYATSYGFIAAAANAHPLVVTAWGSDVLFPEGGRHVAKFLTRHALRTADAVTTVADHMNERVRDIAGRAVDITTIRFGVDLDVFKYAGVRSEDNLLHIICTRNFQPVYDVETLVRAFAVIRENCPARLTLVGDGPERGALERLADTSGVSADVTFKGHVKPAELAAELATADIFVSPALSDGNNVSLTEAMAVGCFPIATDIPANTQWITPGRNGLLYRVGDATDLATAMLVAWADPELRNSASVLNRNIVEERASWRTSVDAMIALYERIISQRQQHR
jgi:glycosyltransferase involved in cell wall biosynthesis